MNRRALLSIIFGTILEWYDFSLFAAMAPIISALFFPLQNKSMALLFTFGVMATGFVIRPLGAIFFGHIGDRLGRTTALSATIILMAIPTTLMGCLPTYHSVGMLAPLLLIILRFVQGAASSGEYPGAICYLTEIAPPNRKGLFGSISMFGVSGGILLGTLINVMLTLALSQEAMYAYGWRIPFLLGLPLGIVGFYLRYQVRDTELFLQLKKAENILSVPIKTVCKTQLTPLIIATSFFALGTVSYYMGFVYIPSYLVSNQKLSLMTSWIDSSIGTAVMIIFIPIFGYLSDNISRFLILLTGASLLVLSYYPLYVIVISDASYLLFLQCAIGFMIAMFVGPVAKTVAELFTTNTRYSGVALALNLGSSLFGGTCPLIAAFIVNHTGDPLLAGFYPVAIAMIAIVFVSILLSKQEVLLIDNCLRP